jgi:hypothetical protein
MSQLEIQAGPTHEKGRSQGTLRWGHTLKIKESVFFGRYKVSVDVASVANSTGQTSDYIPRIWIPSVKREADDLQSISI